MRLEGHMTTKLRPSFFLTAYSRPLILVVTHWLSALR